MKKSFNKNGFTVIEVSLVLAIAGAIFMMLFIALPPLQRSQRDTTRRETMSEFISEIKKYQSSNRGALPSGTGALTVTDGIASGNKDMADWVEFYNKYLGENFVDADGSYYNVTVVTCTTDEAGKKTTAGSDCLNGELTEGNASYKLEYSDDHNLVVAIQASCSGEKAVGTSNPRNLSVLIRLEGSGIYCINS